MGDRKETQEPKTVLFQITTQSKNVKDGYEDKLRKRYPILQNTSVVVQLEKRNCMTIVFETEEDAFKFAVSLIHENNFVSNIIMCELPVVVVKIGRFRPRESILMRHSNAALPEGYIGALTHAAPSLESDEAVKFVVLPNNSGVVVLLCTTESKIKFLEYWKNGTTIFEVRWEVQPLLPRNRKKRVRSQRARSVLNMEKRNKRKVERQTDHIHRKTEQFTGLVKAELEENESLTEDIQELIKLEDSLLGSEHNLTYIPTSAKVEDNFEVESKRTKSKELLEETRNIVSDVLECAKELMETEDNLLESVTNEKSELEDEIDFTAVSDEFKKEVSISIRKISAMSKEPMLSAVLFLESLQSIEGDGNLWQLRSFDAMNRESVLSELTRAAAAFHPDRIIKKTSEKTSLYKRYEIYYAIIAKRELLAKSC